jgi:hypothetical protein
MPASKKKQQQRRRNRGDANAQTGSLPPFVSTLMVKRHSIRWLITSPIGSVGATASTTPITARDVCDWLCVGTSATAAYQLFNSSAKLHRVRIWGPAPAQGTVSQIAIDWSTTATAVIGGPSKRIDCASANPAVSPHVDSRPPKGTQAATWVSNMSAVVLFSLQCPAGSIVQVDYEGTNLESNLAYGTQVNPVAAAPGATYVGSLTASTGLPLATGQTAIGFSALT